MVIEENSVSLLFSSSKSGHIRQSFSSLSLQLHAIYFSYVVGCLIILLKIKAFKFQSNVTLKWNICLKELKTFLFFTLTSLLILEESLTTSKNCVICGGMFTTSDGCCHCLLLDDHAAYRFLIYIACRATDHTVREQSPGKYLSSSAGTVNHRRLPPLFFVVAVSLQDLKVQNSWGYLHYCCLVFCSQWKKRWRY